MPKDTVESILELVRAVAPELPEAKLGAIAQRLHRDMGGERHYFSKAPAAGKAWSLGDEIAAGVPLAQAFANVGVSRATGFRLLNRRGRRF